MIQELLAHSHVKGTMIMPASSTVAGSAVLIRSTAFGADGETTYADPHETL
jgi:hypothetical protein